MLTPDQEWTAREAQIQRMQDRFRPPPEYLKAPKRDFDQHQLWLAVANTGEVTLRDLFLTLTFDTDLKVYQDESLGPSADRTGLEVPHGKVLQYRFAEGVLRKKTSLDEEYTAPQEKIFPTQRRVFPGESFSFHLPAGATVEKGTVRLRWTVFLDDAPPSSGEIDLADYFKRAALTGSARPDTADPQQV